MRAALRELLRQLLKTPGPDWIFDGKPSTFDQVRDLNGVLYDARSDLSEAASLLKAITGGELDLRTALTALVNGKEIASLVRAIVRFA